MALAAETNVDHLIQYSLFFVAGLCLYAACSHFVGGLRTPKDHAQLIFAGMTAVLAVFCMFQSLGLQAHTVDEYVADLRVVLSCIVLLQTSLIWFIAAYCRRYRLWLLGLLSLIGVVFVPLNFTSPYTLQYLAIERLQDQVLPWGEVVTTVQGSSGPWFKFGSAWAALTWIFGIYHFRENYRCNPGWRAAGMMSATVVFYIASIQGALVRLGYIDFIPMGMYGFVFMLVAMGVIMQLDAKDRSERLKHILDHVPAVVYMKNLDGHYLMMNRHYEEQFHIPPGGGVGRSDRDFFPEAQFNEFRRNDALVATTLQTLEAIESADRNGETRSYLSVKFPVLDASGRAIGVAGVSTDITERMKAERALQESERRFRVLADSAPVLIWLTDVDAQYSYFNKSWLEFTGRSTEQECGQGWTLGIHPTDLQQCRSLYRHSFQTREEFRMEYRLRRFDGEYRWLLDTGVPRFDEHGQFRGFIGSCLDITERKLLESALTHQTEQMDAVFAISPDGFVATDDNSRIVLVNPAFTEITGIERADILGERLDYLERRFAELLGDERTFEGFEMFVGDSEGTDKFSSNRWVLCKPKSCVVEIVGRRSRDSRMGLMLFLRDKTSEFEVENMKSEFLAVAAHELRTPTTSILGFSELLLKEAYDEQNRLDLLRIIHDQSLRVSLILDELLDLSRIEARRGLDFSFEDFDIDDVISGVIAEKQGITGAGNIIYTKNRGTLVRADRKKTHQALSNILSNAIKYSPPGEEVEISIERARLEGADQTKVVISDSGIGMSPEQVSRIFERFFRADNSGQVPGTGLGMSIVREIMEIQGGAVEVTSELSKGTKVSLSFKTPSYAYMI